MAQKKKKLTPRQKRSLQRIANLNPKDVRAASRMGAKASTLAPRLLGPSNADIAENPEKMPLSFKNWWKGYGPRVRANIYRAGQEDDITPNPKAVYKAPKKRKPGKISKKKTTTKVVAKKRVVKKKASRKVAKRKKPIKRTRRA